MPRKTQEEKEADKAATVDAQRHVRTQLAPEIPATTTAQAPEPEHEEEHPHGKTKQSRHLRSGA